MLQHMFTEPVPLLHRLSGCMRASIQRPANALAVIADLRSWADHA